MHICIWTNGYEIFCNDDKIILIDHKGSGKSFTMMGSSQDEKLKGIIPRLCDAMFARIAEVGVAMLH